MKDNNLNAIFKVRDDLAIFELKAQTTITTRKDLMQDLAHYSEEALTVLTKKVRNTLQVVMPKAEFTSKTIADIIHLSTVEQLPMYDRASSEDVSMFAARVAIEFIVKNNSKTALMLHFPQTTDINDDFFHNLLAREVEKEANHPVWSILDMNEVPVKEFEKCRGTYDRIAHMLGQMDAESLAIFSHLITFGDAAEIEIVTSILANVRTEVSVAEHASVPVAEPEAASSNEQTVYSTDDFEKELDNMFN